MSRDPDLTKRRRWEVTTVSIGEATGRSTRAVRRDVNAGRLRPWDLVALAQYVLLYATRAGKVGTVTPSEPVQSISAVRHRPEVIASPEPPEFLRKVLEPLGEASPPQRPTPPPTPATTPPTTPVEGVIRKVKGVMC